MKTLQISDAAYEALTEIAQKRGVPPEQLIEQMIPEIPVIYATTGDDFFRQLGASDEEITQVKERAKQLPKNPDW